MNTDTCTSPSPSRSASSLCSNGSCTRKSLIEEIKRVESGEAWEELYAKYHPMIVRLARRRGLRADEAEELVQEVFIRVARTIAGFEHNGRRGAFRRWLSNLTRWRSLDAIRRRLPADEHPAVGREEAGTDGAGDVPAPSSENPSLRVTEADVIDVLIARLSQEVKPKSLQLFCLVTFDGWTPEQVAAQYRMSRGAVDTRLCRVREVARRELQLLGELVRRVPAPAAA